MYFFYVSGGEMMATRLGENIARIRKEKEMSQGMLAVKINKSKQTVYFLESGVTKNPGIETVERIAEALAVPITELIKK